MGDFSHCHSKSKSSEVAWGKGALVGARREDTVQEVVSLVAFGQSMYFILGQKGEARGETLRN